MDKKDAVLEEIFSSVSHGVAAIFSIGATILLVRSGSADIWRVVGFSVFGTSMTLLYLFSCLFHSLIFTKAKKVFNQLDHIFIYLFIAASYTPVVFLSLKNLTGVLLLSAIWILAVLGMIFKSVFFGRAKKLNVAFYLLMGWIAILAIRPLWTRLPRNAFLLLGLGGMLYTIGAAIYSKGKFRFHHLVWHLFVILGSVCHFFVMFSL